jgi:ribose transport system ATP-binding protein
VGVDQTLDEEVILYVNGVNKSFFSTQVLSDVSFNLKRGEVHALAGENGAGKSTMMNIISGILPPDSGEIKLFGKRVKFNSPHDAQKAGIGFVHQELALCPHATVAENIYMNKLSDFTNHVGNINYTKLFKKTEDFLKLFNTKIDPKQIVANLKVADQQVIEILKALSFQCRVLILDEPTSALTETESENLLKIIRNLKSKQISILYISHKIEEIFSIGDRITILRDGHYIDTLDVPDSTPEMVINKMVGRNLTTFYPEKSKSSDEIILSVKNLSIKGIFEDINFELKKGEILGFSGLIGAGRTEVARGLCGIYKADSGVVYLNGQKVDIKKYRDAVRNGIVYLTEDRKENGLFLDLSIEQNITASFLKRIAKLIFINNTKERQHALNFVERLNIKVADVEQKVNCLSGGNQQKVMIAKWLFVTPKVLIMDEPTRGIDIGAKAEIHRMLRDFVNEGMGIIIISSEMPEIIGMCDRVLVMREGAIKGELNQLEINEHNIITLAAAG